MYDWASKQTYIAMANMMTTAALLGIDSCPIEGFNKANVEKYLSEKGLVDPNEFGVSYMLGSGLPERTDHAEEKAVLGSDFRNHRLSLL